MNMIQQAIARARRRVYCQATLTALGWLALAGLAVGLILVLIEHLLAAPMPLWAYGIVAGVVMLLAPILAWTRRPSQAAAATLIDERLQLKDRLGTALYAESLEGHPFARQVVADAQQAASSARVSEAFPIRLTRVWGFVPVGAAVVAVAAVFLTQAQLDPFGLRRAKEQQQADAADAEQAERNIVQARALIRDLNTAESDAIEEADPTQVLKELASLTRRDLTSPQSKRDAMAKLSDVQDKLAAAEESKEREVQAMKSAMSRLDPGKKGPADRFADALRRGDFKAAAAELEALQDKLDKMSEKDKQALQQQLNNLKQQLQQQAQQQQAQQQQAQQQIQQQLQNAGLSQQQTQQLQQQGYNQQQVQQALQNQGMSQQQAQQMAQQIQKQQQQSQQSQNQGQSQNGLSQSLNQMAQSLGQQSRQNQQGQQQGQQQSQQQGQQNQQGQGSQQGQFGQGAWSAQQQLQQMSQMQNQLQQMQQAQSQLHNAMQNLQQGGGQQQQQGGGVGGRKAGTGEGGHPLGYERPPGTHTHYASEDIQDRQGRVIASWYEDGEMAAGDATVEFDQAVTEARDNAERAVADDRVPRRYHEPVREYFKQLPDSPDSVGRAPAAPR